jgi:hypothetical protein
MVHGAKPYIGEGWATTLPLKPKGQNDLQKEVCAL